ncbi:MAG: hypothetical protein K0S65_5364, partial [Labilithrix sp.]|nr:hypothetical protein [Labilithrix sp.]
MRLLLLGALVVLGLVAGSGCGTSDAAEVPLYPMPFKA